MRCGAQDEVWGTGRGVGHRMRCGAQDEVWGTARQPQWSRGCIPAPPHSTVRQTTAKLLAPKCELGSPSPSCNRMGSDLWGPAPSSDGPRSMGHLQAGISGSTSLIWNLWVLISELGWDLWVFISRLSGMGSDPHPAPASKSGHGSPHLPAGTYGPPSPNRDLWVSIAQWGWMGITGLSFAPSSVPHRQRMGGGSRGSDAGTRPAGSSRPWRNSSSSTAAQQRCPAPSPLRPLPHPLPQRCSSQRGGLWTAQDTQTHGQHCRRRLCSTEQRSPA